MRVIGVGVLRVLQGGFIVRKRLLVGSFTINLMMFPWLLMGLGLAAPWWEPTATGYVACAIGVGLFMMTFTASVCWLGDQRIWLLYAPWRSPRYSEVWLVEEVEGKYFAEVSGGSRVRFLSADNEFTRRLVADERRERILGHIDAARQRAAVAQQRR